MYTKEDCDKNDIRLKALSDSLWPEACALFKRYGQEKYLANLVAHNNHIIKVEDDGVIFDCGIFYSTLKNQAIDSGLWKCHADPKTKASFYIERREWEQHYGDSMGLSPAMRTSA